MRYIVSLDCWGTIIKPNPKFKEAKNELLRSLLSDNGALMFEKQVKDFKQNVDSLAENLGMTVPREFIYNSCLTKDLSIKIMGQYDKLFVENPPIILDGTYEFLCDKCNDDGCLSYLSCNSVMAPGSLLRITLAEANIGNLFLSQNYSDELKLAKPRYEMFQFMGSLSFLGVPPRTPRIHIGDNPKTDGRCVEHGIHFIQVETDRPNWEEVEAQIQEILKFYR